MNKMNTKIVINGEAGKPVNGSHCLLEVNGVIVDGQVPLTTSMEPNEVATVTIVLVLPEIEYRSKK